MPTVPELSDSKIQVSQNLDQKVEKTDELSKPTVILGKRRVDEANL